MKKPYVICHMMSSVDGKILTKQWGKVAGMASYEQTGSSHKADAWMCGRVTMERDFASDKPLKLKAVSKAIDRKDFQAENKAKTFAVAIDQAGNCIGKNRKLMAIISFLC